MQNNFKLILLVLIAIIALTSCGRNNSAPSPALGVAGNIGATNISNNSMPSVLDLEKISVTHKLSSVQQYGSQAIDYSKGCTIEQQKLILTGNGLNNTTNYAIYKFGPYTKDNFPVFGKLTTGAPAATLWAGYSDFKRKCYRWKRIDPITLELVFGDLESCISPTGYTYVVLASTNMNSIGSVDITSRNEVSNYWPSHNYGANDVWRLSDVKEVDGKPVFAFGNYNSIGSAPEKSVYYARAVSNRPTSQDDWMIMPIGISGDSAIPPVVGVFDKCPVVVYPSSAKTYPNVFDLSFTYSNYPNPCETDWMTFKPKYYDDPENGLTILRDITLLNINNKPVIIYGYSNSFTIASNLLGIIQFNTSKPNNKSDFIDYSILCFSAAQAGDYEDNSCFRSLIFKDRIYVFFRKSKFSDDSNYLCFIKSNNLTPTKKEDWSDVMYVETIKNQGGYTILPIIVNNALSIVYSDLELNSNIATYSQIKYAYAKNDDPKQSSDWNILELGLGDKGVDCGIGLVYDKPVLGYSSEHTNDLYIFQSSKVQPTQLPDWTEQLVWKNPNPKKGWTTQLFVFDNKPGFIRGYNYMQRWIESTSEPSITSSPSPFPFTFQFAE